MASDDPGRDGIAADVALARWRLIPSWMKEKPKVPPAWSCRELRLLQIEARRASTAETKAPSRGELSADPPANSLHCGVMF